MEHKTVLNITVVQYLYTRWMQWIDEIQGQVYRNHRDSIIHARITLDIWFAFGSDHPVEVETTTKPDFQVVLCPIDSVWKTTDMNMLQIQKNYLKKNKTNTFPSETRNCNQVKNHYFQLTRSEHFDLCMNHDGSIQQWCKNLLRPCIRVPQTDWCPVI